MRALRLAREQDAEGVLAIYAPVVRETAISFELEPPGVAEMRQRMSATLEHSPWLVSEQDGTLTGYAYSGPFRARPAYRWTTELTVYVHADHRGQGVARALYTTLVEAARIAGYRSAIGGIALPNPASVALHESLGFRPAGVLREAGYKLGRWHDVGFWQLSLGGAPDAPAPPRSIEQLLGAPEWAAALRRGEALLPQR